MELALFETETLRLMLADVLLVASQSANENLIREAATEAARNICAELNQRSSMVAAQYAAHGLDQLLAKRP